MTELLIALAIAVVLTLLGIATLFFVTIIGLLELSKSEDLYDLGSE